MPVGGMTKELNHIEVSAPAKINFFLQVTGRRPDGYHNLRTVMCCVGLYDTVVMDFRTGRTSIACNHPEVPTDETNLAYRAAMLFFKALGQEETVEIRIHKTIPVGAGLGGGSSDAAAVLIGLNHYFSQPFSLEKLMSMGSEIGADVPFLIFRKPAFATGIGEKISPCGSLRPYWILLVNPGFSVSTAMVYKKLNLRLTKCKKKISNLPFKEAFLDAAEFLYNDLESVTASMFPEIDRMKRLLLDLGARGALMSGSGPTVFGLFEDMRAGEKAYQALTSFDLQQKFLVEMLT